MQPTKRPGRPPANPSEGAAKNYTVRLTDAQVARALQHGETINQGINALLREQCALPDLAPALKWALDQIADDLDPDHQDALKAARELVPAVPSK